jgi:hypothetical protein
LRCAYPSFITSRHLASRLDPALARSSSRQLLLPIHGGVNAPSDDVNRNTCEPLLEQQEQRDDRNNNDDRYEDRVTHWVALMVHEL